MRHPTIALCIAAITALGAVAAEAQGSVEISLAGQVVARIRTAGQYGSLYEREAKIYQRITGALTNELDAIFPGTHTTKAKVTVAKASGRYTLSVGNTWLIQAYPEDAVGTDTRTLILQWQDKFATCLPQAVSPIDVPTWYKGPRPDALPDKPEPSGLPACDDPLVDALVREMARIRQMSDEQFEAQADGLEAAVIAMVANYRQPDGYPDPPRSYIRVRSLFTVMRGDAMTDHKFAITKRSYAGTTIQKVREKFKVPAGTGPVPSVDEVLLPEVRGSTIPTTPPVTPPEDQPIPEPEFMPGTPIATAILGTGVDQNNRLLGAGQQFAADTGHLVLYLQVKNAPANTMMVVTMRMGESVIGTRGLNLCGDHTLGVNFHPATADCFSPGDYICELTIGGQVAGVIPFRIGET